MAVKKCPKCGSNNITYQREQTTSVGNSKHSFGGGLEVKKGITYWLLIGWWAWIFKSLLNTMVSCFTLGFVKLKKRDKVSGKTTTKIKTTNHTVAVCQNCGHTWNA